MFPRCCCRHRRFVIHRRRARPASARERHRAGARARCKAFLDAQAWVADPSDDDFITSRKAHHCRRAAHSLYLHSDIDEGAQDRVVIRCAYSADDAKILRQKSFSEQAVERCAQRSCTLKFHTLAASLEYFSRRHKFRPSLIGAFLPDFVLAK